MIVVKKHYKSSGIKTCDECGKVLSNDNTYDISCDFKAYHILMLCKDCIPKEWRLKK
jgi:hypothetical protein